MQSRSPELEHCIARCSELETQLQQLQEQSERCMCDASLDSNTSSNSRLHQELGGIRLRATVLKSLAYDRSQRIERLTSSIAAQKQASNKSEAMLREQLEHLEMSISALKRSFDERMTALKNELEETTAASLKEKNSIAGALKKSSDENRALRKRLKEMESSYTSVVKEKNTLERAHVAVTDDRTALENRLADIKSSKSFRAGRVLANSLSSVPSFLKTPLLLNQIRKETSTDSSSED